MSFAKATLLRRTLLALSASAALLIPVGAQAGILNGLSIRGGLLRPERSDVRSITDFGAWGGGVDYKFLRSPETLDGEYWSTSLSVDFHYSERKAGVVRYMPVSLNEIYTFAPRNGTTPFAGFCVTAATMGTTSGDTIGHTPTVTRFGGGVILGLNMGSHFYIEGRYEWIDSAGLGTTPEGFRGYLGYRF